MKRRPGGLGRGLDALLPARAAAAAGGVLELDVAAVRPLEEAAAYRQLVEEHGLTQEAVATRVGKSRVAVANALRLLNLAPVVRDALLAGRVTAGHARALLACPDDATQAQLLARVL